MYGTQASVDELKARNMFENDVKMYGTQAIASTWRFAELV